MLGMHGDAEVGLSASKSARNVTSTSLTLEALYSFRVKMEGNYTDTDTLGNSDEHLEHVLRLTDKAI